MSLTRLVWQMIHKFSHEPDTEPMIFEGHLFVEELILPDAHSKHIWEFFVNPLALAAFVPRLRSAKPVQSKPDLGLR